MSEKKENREEEKEQSSSRSGLNDEQIEAALNACTFWKTKEVRCKDCPLDSDKEPCMTNLHLAALACIRRLKHRAAVAEMALKIADELGELCGRKEDYVQQAEKELQEKKKSD